MNKCKEILFFILALGTLSQSIFSKEYVREEGGCFPLSTVKYHAGLKSFNNGLSEAEFNQIIDNAVNVLKPEIKRRLNKQLIVEKRWNDDTVDAFATRDDNNNPVVVMNGGLARHPLMTTDAFLLLICHEMGHHLGGAPKILRGNSGLRSWSSAEGQADYYATSKCLPLFYKSGINIKAFDTEEDTANYRLAITKCRDNSCAKITMAGFAVSNLFASLVDGTPRPKLSTTDVTKVSKTIYKHANPQCRLDTYFSGATCEIGPEVPFDAVDPKVGACDKDAGARPACWFKESDF